MYAVELPRVHRVREEGHPRDAHRDRRFREHRPPAVEVFGLSTGARDRDTQPGDLSYRAGDSGARNHLARPDRRVL